MVSSCARKTETRSAVGYSDCDTVTFSRRSVLIRSKVDEQTFDKVCETLVHEPLGMPIADLVRKTNLPKETVTAVVRACVHADWLLVTKHVMVYEETRKGGNCRPVYRFTDKGYRLFRGQMFDIRRELR